MTAARTPTPDNSTLRAPTAEEAHDMLMLRSVGAMTIAEGEEGWQRVPLDCPMLVAVAALRNSHDALVAALVELLGVHALSKTREGCETDRFDKAWKQARAALKAAKVAK